MNPPGVGSLIQDIIEENTRHGDALSRLVRQDAQSPMSERGGRWRKWLEPVTPKSYRRDHSYVFESKSPSSVKSEPEAFQCPPKTEAQAAAESIRSEKISEAEMVNMESVRNQMFMLKVVLQLLEQKSAAEHKAFANLQVLYPCLPPLSQVIFYGNMKKGKLLTAFSPKLVVVVPGAILYTSTDGSNSGKEKSLKRIVLKEASWCREVAKKDKSKRFFCELIDGCHSESCLTTYASYSAVESHLSTTCSKISEVMEWCASSADERRRFCKAVVDAAKMQPLSEPHDATVLEKYLQRPITCKLEYMQSIQHLFRIPFSWTESNHEPKVEDESNDDDESKCEDESLCGSFKTRGTTNVVVAMSQIYNDDQCTIPTETHFNQVLKDLQRDRVLINGQLLTGCVGTGRDFIDSPGVCSIMTSLSRTISTHSSLVQPFDESTCLDVAHQVLRACDRTYCGAITYDAVAKIFAHEEYVFIAADSAKTDPLGIFITSNTAQVPVVKYKHRRSLSAENDSSVVDKRRSFPRKSMPLATCCASIEVKVSMRYKICNLEFNDENDAVLCFAHAVYTRSFWLAEEGKIFPKSAAKVAINVQVKDQ